jgi:hypothetical protein
MTGPASYVPEASPLGAVSRCPRLEQDRTTDPRTRQSQQDSSALAAIHHKDTNLACLTAVT